ncbi:unnamed protein product [Adineta steineri]|uniref:Uncharacterized protein n=1 Tax=Adineta steineri TaxID=433720 RepID=A0A813Z1Y6_9BILA|nr:unnamed protein product [Adineta steineri]CAF0901570.1 unnamed protein product [Adineta steineri]CAF0948740.1 unnamed protein product [Adineta steineri]CAF3794230.1 unnamed protein product [Adineta steineri]CAF4011371.1 unnamed protein product [Adineta steineri]
MTSWFTRIIDMQQWTAAWNSTRDLYVLRGDCDTSDNSSTKQSFKNIVYNRLCHIGSKEYTNVHEYWNGDIIDASV